MSDEIELIGDGDGVLVVGENAAVERFLGAAGVSRLARSPKRAAQHTLEAGATTAQLGAQVAENSGRWVKLTKESAQALKVGDAMKGSSGEVARAVAMRDGKITKILEFAKPGEVGSLLSNPAVLAGAAGVMAQMAMQQTMDEITDYLKTIDRKVDDVLRAQKDAALAEMIGVGFVLDEAMTVREHTGRVSEVTWSKVQAAAQTVAVTQAYALRQLDALAEKFEGATDVSDLDKLAKGAAESVEEWLAVLARCFQLQEGLAVLEIDRILDDAPEEVDLHRRGLRVARQHRKEQIAATTGSLLARLDAALSEAGDRVLLHPLKAKSVVRSGNALAQDVVIFHERLGIEREREDLEAKRWAVAAVEAKDKVVEAGEVGANAVKRAGAWTLGGARNLGAKLADEVKERRETLRGGMDRERPNDQV